MSNLKKIPDGETLQPLYEVQVIKCDAFKQHYAWYETAYCIENQLRDYQKPYMLVKQFLDKEQKHENDRLALGESAGWSLAAYENAVPKLRPGDCRTKFCTGRCNWGDCPWKYYNFLPAEFRKQAESKRKGKGKGKGKGKDKGEERKGAGKGTDGKRGGKGTGKGKDSKKGGKGKDNEKGKKGKGQGQKETRTCHFCGKVGHLSEDCFHNPENLFGQSTHKNNRWSSNSWAAHKDYDGQNTTGKSPRGKWNRTSCKWIKAGQCNACDNCRCRHPQPCRIWQTGKKCQLGDKFVYRHDTGTLRNGGPRWQTPTGTLRKRTNPLKNRGNVMPAVEDVDGHQQQQTSTPAQSTTEPLKAQRVVKTE